mmetsp:Transcript_38402/g.120959  ORF Transcript_38402/g.120959 Transcript_38402/m.120959 type:complete len:569 (+) Transcript_38402:1788-3494(+)
MENTLDERRSHRSLALQGDHDRCDLFLSVAQGERRPSSISPCPGRQRAVGTALCSRARSSASTRGGGEGDKTRGRPGRRRGLVLHLLGHRLGLLNRLLHRANHVEGLLGQVVVLAGEQAREALDRLRERAELARLAGEDLGDVEGLREEALDLARARHNHLVVLGELVHAEDGDDVLQRLVVLQHLLHAARNLVVLVADDARVEDARGRVERVDGGVDALLGDAAREHGGRVQVGEGGGGGGVGQVIGRHVDSLDRSDGALRGGGDALLQPSHVGREGRLVADGRRDAAEQRRHLGARLGEAEDVVDEEEHVLPLLVAEVLGDGQRRERHPRPRARRLVHLPVDERSLGAFAGRAVVLDDARGHHLVVQVVALARALADAGKDGETAVGLCDVVDQLHNHDGLAHAGAAKEPDLAALGVRLNQVNHLDARREHLLLDRLLGEDGRLLVDRRHHRRVDRALLVDRLTDDVHDAAEHAVAHGDADGRLRVNHGLPAHEALGGVHRDGAHRALPQVLRNLEDEPDLVALDLEAVEDSRQRPVKLHVHHRTDDRRHLASGLLARSDSSKRRF